MFEESLIETTQFINGNFEGASRKVTFFPTNYLAKEIMMTTTNYINIQIT